ncbi:MAG: hypothetical protein WAL47_17950, partial [Pyrinomonadaceae bacterium]
MPIDDGGFSIGFFRYGLIGNRQSQIGNRRALPLPRGGTDLTGSATRVKRQRVAQKACRVS